MVTRLIKYPPIPSGAKTQADEVLIDYFIYLETNSRNLL